MPDSLQDSTVDRFLRVRPSVWELPDEAAPYVPPADHPRVALIVGGPAAGKTMFRGSAEGLASLPPWNASVHIDLDEIKELLPSFGAIRTEEDAEGVHTEAVEIARRLLDECLARGVSVTIEGAGASPRFPGQLEHLRALCDASGKEWKLEVSYVSCDIDEAVRRAEASDKYVIPGWVLSDFDFLEASLE